ncbi:hypothetical protein [Flavobacterium tructae]|uniref:Lipoprotein n=1 Tax=Flavobacterium tructae TaxID=1114873 RepID=A0A1S1IZV8_9FLAO|nr:hypothetical protein [Flavobacterium tructae]MDL2142630.1 hypothetical protein [Flavobacterium tructae]OHT43867.1 hypothetical protein BHE19_16125 [Flavobacterium tructae]OXB21619.1 hypothetical protein B0A71_03695 [Flavobacterium tructae]
MRKFLIFIPIIALGCVNTLQEDRLYLKEIKVKNKVIEWFYYSNVASTSADYILLYDSKNDRSDTIVNSTNIKDVRLTNDTITLYFYGKPKIYDTSIIIKKKMDEFKIIIDTNAISPGPGPSRKSYLKKDL